MNSIKPSIQPEWRLIYQLSILDDITVEKTLADSLAVELEPMEMPTEFLQKVTQSIQDSVETALDILRLARTDFQLKLFVYVPKKRKAHNHKRNWGFFRVEKREPASILKNHPAMYSIEFYLYLDG
jgi:hypothetical protein